MGSRLASGIGATFRTVGKGVGLAAGAVIGTALSQGMKRMVAIDDAKGKLAGLGHTAEGVAGIMDSALAAVRGTAFGLGDAATIAASAVAAGVQPGQELTRYLSLTADAATIAGSSLSEMGSILNKVTTMNKAYTDDLNMLADRGIPIYQWLQEEYGVTADTLSDMVKKGQVDAATFRKVIEENIGGAALESGKTLRGSFENMKAALGRLGEGALTPFMPLMQNGLAAVTRWADQITPKVKEVAQGVADGLLDMGRAFQSNGASVEGTASFYEKAGIKAREAYEKIRGFAERVRESIAAFRESEDGSRIASFWQTLTGAAEKASAGMEKAESSGFSFSEALSKLGNAASSIGTSLVKLAGDTGTVLAHGLRLAGNAMGYLADNAGVATGAMVGLVGAMAVGKLTHIGYEWSRIAQAIMTPAVIASTLAQTRAITQHNEAIRAYLAARGIEITQTNNGIRARIAEAAARTREAIATRAAASALGQYAAAQQLAAASSVGLVAGMQRTTAAAATMGARVQATAVTAFGGLQRAASGALSMLGGAWGVGIMAATAGILANASSANSAKQAQETLAAAVISGAKAQNEFLNAVSQSNGALNDQAVAAGMEAVKAGLTETIALAERGHSSMDTLGHGIDNLTFNVFGANDEWEAEYDKVSGAIERYDTLKSVMSDMKIELDDVYRITAKGGPEFDVLVRKLEESGQAGKDVAKTLKDTRQQLQDSADAAKNSTPGFGSLTAAIRTLADESANADDRVNAMKRALDALSGKPVELGDAMQRYNQVLRDTVALGDSWDPAKGFGAEQLVLPDGQINTETENGDKLRTSLGDLRDAVVEVAQAGGDLPAVFAEVNAKYAELAEKTGLSAEQVKTLAENMGLVPTDIEALVRVQGADKATQDLTAIQLLLENNRDGAVIDTKVLGSQEVINQLRDAGAKVEEVTGKPGVFKVDAPNIDQVLAKLNQLISAKIPDKYFQIVADSQTAEARIARFGNANVQGPLPIPRRATGGPGPLTGPVVGPGGPTSDSILTALSAGEHVLTADEVSKAGGHGAIYQIRQMIRSGVKLTKRAKGGPIGIENALKAARSAEGKKYVWGGTGPDGWDCSGFIGWLQQIAMGIVGSTERIYTTMSLIAGQTAGLVQGLGPAGTFFQVGVSQDHMAGTIDGRPVESGGAHGTSGIGGGRAGAADSQFPYKFHLPNNLIDGWTGQNSKRAKRKQWTESDQIELDRAQIQVEQEKAQRDKVYENPKSTDNDKRLADLDVRAAEQRVLDKIAERDGTSEDDTDAPAPEAPALARTFTEEESDRIDKLAAVEQARLRRNEVYDDPDSTEIDRLKADAEYSQALQDANNPKKEKDGNTPKTLRDVLTGAASEFVGIAFDAAKQQLPDEIGSSHWWDVADKSIALASDYEESGKADEARKALGLVPSFPDEQIDAQLGYNPGAGEPPEWIKKLRENPPKVFDTGGWLMPGEMGINLSNTPEPIFNSPAQLQKFAGSALGDPAATGIRLEDLAEVLASRPSITLQVNDMKSAREAMEWERYSGSAAFRGR